MIRALQARIDAIEEIINEKTYHMEKLRGLLVNIPDLVKGLTRIQYGKVPISTWTMRSANDRRNLPK